MRVVVHQFDGVSTLDALPLAAGLLVASARLDEGLRERCTFEVRTLRGRPDEAAAACEGAGLLAFSAYTWNERHSLEVARLARARNAGARIVFGGPSVPRRPERAAAFLREYPFVDALALGEGEATFRELARAALEGAPLDGVAGLALRDPSHPDGARLTAPRARLTDFSGAASPYLDGTFDGLLGAGARPGAAILETNRGCPFHCTFCDWGQAVASPVHELPWDRLAAELAWVGRHRIPYVYVVDANFGIRKRDLEIVRELGRVKASTGFPQYVFFHLTKNATERHLEVVLAVREAGIGTHLALSAQDFEPRVLLAVKRDNIRLDRALELRRLCHERGIPTFNELILGLPEQTYDSFARSMAQAVTPYAGDAFNLYLARMLENAEMASPEDRARYGLQTRWLTVASFHREEAAEAVPEEEEIVVATAALPPDEWRRAYKYGYFLAAAHNLRLLDVVLQVAWRAAGVELRGFLESLLARMGAAPPGSALAAVDEALERHADAVQEGRAMVLPAEGTGRHLWAVEDAVLVAALASGGSFWSEVGQFAGDELSGEAAELVVEAVRYQRFLSPLPGEAEPREERFAWDLPAWRRQPPSAQGPRAARSPVQLRFTPAPGLAMQRDLKGFALAWLGAVHARQPLGAERAAEPG